ncbi:MAG: hypothetical protein GDA51_09195 [Ekhidna sp.]|nr:hypothetical protein [Ekhidna sp.]
MELIFIGAGGGLPLQLLSLLELPNIEKDRPDFKDWVYYIPYVVNPILGAFIVFVYLKTKTEFNLVLALHIGTSAPVILRTMASSIPKIK